MRFHPVSRGVISLAAVNLLVSSCALLIPENPSQPRYNTVLGQRHMPVENAASMRGAASNATPMAAPAPPMQQTPAMEPQSSVQPMAQTTMADLPPVDPETQRIAQQRMMEAQQPRERSLWDRLAFWRDDDEAMPATMARSVPVENQAAVMNSSEDYPMLSQVPPAPPVTGADSQAARLAKVRTEMERDRSTAAQARAQLSSDASAEPSMLSGLPPTAGVAPAPEPIVSAPVPPPPTPIASSAPVRMDVPHIAPPPPMPVYATRAPAYTAPAPVPVYTQPAPLEPIVLRAPVTTTPAPKPAPSYARAPAPQSKPARSMLPAAGSFDPMAGEPVASANTPYYNSSSGYLPPSRYTYRR